MIDSVFNSDRRLQSANHHGNGDLFRALPDLAVRIADADLH
jgi:hypothetical protein